MMNSDLDIHKQHMILSQKQQQQQYQQILSNLSIPSFNNKMKNFNNNITFLNHDRCMNRMDNAESNIYTKELQMHTPMLYNEFNNIQLSTSSTAKMFNPHSVSDSTSISFTRKPSNHLLFVGTSHALNNNHHQQQQQQLHLLANHHALNQRPSSSSSPLELFQSNEQMKFMNLLQLQKDMKLKKEKQLAASAVVHQLLEENNNLMTLYTEYSKSPLQGSATVAMILEQIGNNLNKISQFVDKESSDSPGTTPYSVASSVSSQQYELPNMISLGSKSNLMQHDQPSISPLPPVSTNLNGFISNNIVPQNQAGIPSSWSKQVPLNKLSFLFPAKQQQQHSMPFHKIPSIPSLIIPSSGTSSANDSPVTSPNAKPYSVDHSEISLRLQSLENKFKPNMTNDAVKAYAGSIENQFGKRSRSNENNESDEASYDIHEQDNVEEESDQEFKIRNQSKTKKPRYHEKVLSTATSHLYLTTEEIVKELDGLPVKFAETLTHLTRHELKHWQGIKRYINKANKRASELSDTEKWRAWVEVTAELPLNNGGPIRRVLEIAKFTAESYDSNPEIAKILGKALSPSVYKVNAAGGCRKMALEMLQLY